MAETDFNTCDNKNLSPEQIFKKLLAVDAAGNPILKVTQVLGASSLNIVGGLSEERKVNLTSTAYQVKASAGNLLGWNIINPNGSAVYVKLYDLLAAGTTVGTSTPKLTIMVPANGTVYVAPNCIQEEFADAITMAVTTGVADSDNTNPGSAVHVHLKYN